MNLKANAPAVSLGACSIGKKVNNPLVTVWLIVIEEIYWNYLITEKKYIYILNKLALCVQ